jgi:hypothetical protein
MAKTQAHKWIKFQPLTQYWGFGVTLFLDLVNNEIDIFSLGITKFQLKGCLMKCNEDALSLFHLNWTSNYTGIDLKNTFPWSMGWLLRYVIWPTYVKIHGGYKLDLWIQFCNKKKKKFKFVSWMCKFKNFFYN